MVGKNECVPCAGRIEVLSLVIAEDARTIYRLEGATRVRDGGTE